MCELYSLRRVASLFLSISVLITFLFNSNLVSAEDSTSEEMIPSIYVQHTRFNPFFVQAVYLEPETEYVFSYLYSNLPASTEAFFYTDADHNFSAQDRTYSSDENRLVRSFTTVSLDTDGVVEGTGENSGKILSYIGIRMYAVKNHIDLDDSDYINGKCIYGGFELYKKNDRSKTNIFRDLNFADIGYNSYGDGTWTSFPVVNSNYAQCNFARYDADPDIEGVQHPKADIYKCSFSELCLKLTSVSGSPHFVQKIWLKPNTQYTFSYCYSKAPASFGIIYKSLSSDSAYKVTTTQEDACRKRIYYTFTTTDSTDSSTVTGTGGYEGLVQAVIGLQFDSGDKNLVGGYYADLRVYESDDEKQKNLFEDQRYLNIGTLAEGKTWHGITSSSNAASALKKVDSVTSAAFDRYYTVHAADVEGGRITVSRNYAFEGDSVTVNVLADDGYVLKNGSVKANDTEIYGSDGVYTFECPAENVTVNAIFECDKEIPSIHVLHTRYSPYFVQEVYLEPETEYVFSYLYNNLPASMESLCYTDANHEFPSKDRTYSSDEKRLIRSFTTVSLDTDGVVEGTGENAGKILSYIGIRMYALSGNVSADDTKYTNGKCLYADFILNRADDADKTNLFRDSAFTSIGYNSSGDGVWTSLPAANSNFAQLNFARYDAEPNIAGTQFPKAGIYAKDKTYSAVQATSITGSVQPYLVQTVWLKPNTTYVYSFMYSAALPSVSVVLKDTTEKKYDVSTPVYDDKLNKVTYEFTTKDKNDADTVYDSSTGLVKALVGIRIYNDRTDLLKSYFGDFILYEKEDSNKTNLISDTVFSDIGTMNNTNTWNGMYGSVNAKMTFTAAGQISENYFKKNRTVSVGSSENGTIKLSTSTAKSGDTVYITAIPADGYWFSGFYTSGGAVKESFGRNTAITVPMSDVTIHPVFKEMRTGDSNGDDLVDIRDLVRIKKHLADDIADIVLENTDCNSDGTIDAIDSALVRKSILGIIYGIDMIPITGGMVNMGLSGGADDQAEKLRTQILLATDELTNGGRVYYVSENGKDYNSGVSASKPIKTIDKLSCLPLKSGDTVLFERGSTFRLNSRYNCVAGVTYGAYGSGDKPKFYGSQKNYATVSWTATDYDNIWKTNLSKVASDSGDVGIIVFDFNKAVGTKQYSIEALIADGYFYYDNSEQAVYIYCSKGNPSSVYSDIEIGRKMNMFTPSSGATLDNLSFYYTGAHAIASGGGISNVTITNCEIGWIGGSSHMDTRYGNGIQFWNGCENIEISNCWIYQVYDAGITFQGDNEEAEYKNITFKNNLIEYCSWSVEWWSGYEKPYDYALSLCDIGEISNILIDSNIMRFEGNGWALSTRMPTSIHGPWGVRTFKNFSDFVVSNNIFDCPNGEFVKWMQSSYTEAQQGYSMFGNSYYHKSTSDNIVFFLGTVGQTYASNQSELEKAVAMFDSNPKMIKWID